MDFGIEIAPDVSIARDYHSYVSDKFYLRNIHTLFVPSLCLPHVQPPKLVSVRTLSGATNPKMVFER